MRDLLEIAFGLTLLWVVARYYWLRIIACAALLASWGAVVIVAPLYLVVTDVANGRVFEAVLTIAGVGLLGAFWYMAFEAGRKWVGHEIATERWIKMPWNAR